MKSDSWRATRDWSASVEMLSLIEPLSFKGEESSTLSSRVDYEQSGIRLCYQRFHLTRTPDWLLVFCRGVASVLVPVGWELHWSMTDASVYSLIAAVHHQRMAPKKRTRSTFRESAGDELHFPWLCSDCLPGLWRWSSASWAQAKC